MARPRPAETSTPTTSERKLSDVAKHLVVPSGIKTTGYPTVEAQCRKMSVQHDPWQKGLARAILAKRANGLYAADIGGVRISICRQVGKTSRTAPRSKRPTVLPAPHPHPPSRRYGTVTPRPSVPPWLSN